MNSVPGAAARDRYALGVSLLFAAISLVIGVNLPFLPVWLDWVGLDAREIAIIIAAPLVARIALAPAIAFAADRAGDHRRFLIVLAWAALAVLIALAQARRFWPILALAFLFSLAWTPIVPLTETIAMTGVKGAGLDYGRMRLWGSLSFIAASLCGGLAVETFGARVAMWLMIGGAAATAAAAHGLVEPLPRSHAEPYGDHYETPRARPLAGPRAADGGPRVKRDGAALLASPAFLLFLTATGAVQAAHAVLYTFSTLHWRALGLSPAASGGLWAVSIVAEVVLFAYARGVIARIDAPRLIVLGAGAAVIRWLAMGFDPPLLLLVPLQALHGLTFAATHLGAMHFIARTVADALGATAQALHAATTSGIFMAAAILSAGPLYAAYAGRAYWAMAIIAAAGLAAALLLMATSRFERAA